MDDVDRVDIVSVVFWNFTLNASQRYAHIQCTGTLFNRPTVFWSMPVQYIQHTMLVQTFNAVRIASY